MSKRLSIAAGIILSIAGFALIRPELPGSHAAPSENRETTLSNELQAPFGEPAISADDSQNVLPTNPDTSSVQQRDSAAVVMRFAGDCLLGGHYERAAANDVGMAFDGFTLFHEADIALVNLENPVTTRGRKMPKTYNFRMHPRFLTALTGAGIGVVSIANNHVFDYGSEGLFDTFLYLDSAGIRYVGAGRNIAEARRPYVFRKDSQSVGILGYYGGGEAPGATVNRGGVARRDLATIREDVRSLHAADSLMFVVVILHWGTELAEAPDHAQRAFARALIDAGVDAVIGHHAHVLQGIEKYRNGVIVYSLGNFVFGGNSRHTYTTGIFEIVLRNQQPAYRFIPIGVREWRVRALDGKDAERVLNKVRLLSLKFPSTIFTD